MGVAARSHARRRAVTSRVREQHEGHLLRAWGRPAFEPVCGGGWRQPSGFEGGEPRKHARSLQLFRALRSKLLLLRWVVLSQNALATAFSCAPSESMGLVTEHGFPG